MYTNTFLSETPVARKNGHYRRAVGAPRYAQYMCMYVCIHRYNVYMHVCVYIYIYIYALIIRAITIIDSMRNNNNNDNSNNNKY